MVTLHQMDFFAGKRVAITGAGGTVGSELVRILLQHSVIEVRALDTNENALFRLGQDFDEDKRFQAFVCDVRNESKLLFMFKDMDFVFHAAALKHVPLSERSPSEAVLTNITGVQNVIRAAQFNKVDRVLFTSSDKAVNPTNVMGTTKLMGERLMTAANALNNGGDKTVFASTRFGNVAGSAGSVIPLFCQQIMMGGPVTLTDVNMTRFMMTLDEAVRLVMKSIEIACGGEVFVIKMPVVRIADLAEALIDLVAPIYGRAPSSIEIRIIGPRPGEKQYEELSTSEESRRLLEIGDMYAVLPAFRNIYDGIAYEYGDMKAKQTNIVYNSEDQPVKTREEILELLHEPTVLPEEIRLQLPKRVRVA